MMEGAYPRPFASTEAPKLPETLPFEPAILPHLPESVSMEAAEILTSLGDAPKSPMLPSFSSLFSSLTPNQVSSFSNIKIKSALKYRVNYVAKVRVVNLERRSP